MTSTKKYSFIDLFSGAGGMSYGFAQHALFTPCFAVDAQLGKPSSGAGKLDCNATYTANIGIPVHEANLAIYSPEELMARAGVSAGDVEVLISCAPCTGFSRTLNKNHSQDDARNNLVERTGAFVEALRPAILIMENARELLRGNFSHHAHRLRDHLSALGYEFYGSIHKLTAFGLPQIRERALIIAVRKGIKLRKLEELWEDSLVRDSALHVRRAISQFPAVAAGRVHPDDAMHQSPAFADALPVRRLKAMPHDGGSWFDMIRSPGADELLTPAMKRTAARGDFGSHPDVYGRLWWDRPCVTIKRECSHVGNGRYSHPEQNRLCTVREMATMNGFPVQYTFSGSLSNKYRHIGDAVPPLISHQLAYVCQWILGGKRQKIADCILPGSTLCPDDITHRPGLFSVLKTA